MTQQFDVIIIGAGVAGCAAAIALLQQRPHSKVLLLERHLENATPFRIGETLPAEISVLFQQLGLLQRFEARGDLKAQGTRSRWGDGALNETPSLYSPYGHGWHIDRVSFDAWLQREAEQAGAVIMRGADLVEKPQYGDAWSVSVQENGQRREINTPLLVDASGRGHVLGRNLGVKTQSLDKLVAVYRFFSVNDKQDGMPFDSHTLVESCPQGWWYSARLPQGQWVAALMTDSDLAQQHAVMDEAQWHKALQEAEHTSERLAELEAITPLQVRPAHTQKLSQYCGPGWFAVGDAANTFDPLSSLGIFKAIRQGMLVSHALIDKLTGKADAERKYQHVLDLEFRNYLATRRDYYCCELRWSESKFWQRRHFHAGEEADISWENPLVPTVHRGNAYAR